MKCCEYATWSLPVACLRQYLSTHPAPTHANPLWIFPSVYARRSYWRGRLSTVDLLVLTSLDQLLFTLKILFTFLTKQATIMRKSTVLSLSPQLVFPGLWQRSVFDHVSQKGTICIINDQAQCHKTFFTDFRNVLECLSLVSFSSLV